MTIKAIIFDMGGVLVRTEDSAPRDRLAAEFGITREELLETVFNSSTSIQAECGKIHQDAHWQAVFARWQVPALRQADFIQTFWSGDRINTDLVEKIRNWKEKYKIGLLSNAWDGSRALVEGQFHFLNVFDVSVFSAEVGIRKPAAEIFHTVLKKLDVLAEEAIFVDDFSANIEGASRVGLRTVHFVTTEQAVQAINIQLHSSPDTA